MAFQEVHASQFTSPTTPYTGCRHAEGFFATETHSFHCSCKENEDIKVTAGPLPPSQEHCVGHDQSGAWEFFAFLDPSVNEEEAQEQVNNAPSEHYGHRRTSQSSASFSSLAPEGEPADASSTTIAWLVLKSRESLAPTFTASLSFRPLSPMLTTRTLDHHSEDESKVVAWVGSADDPKLRCYIASEDNNDCPILKEVDLKDDVFNFDSPVMVMDSLTRHKGSRNQQHYLIAVGCQDGTVRIIHYQRTGDSLSFQTLAAHTILVDGPIMALHLSETNDTTNLVVGSMCGFVCCLKKTNGEWQGPWMVAEGLWNSSLDSEDAVLAVNMLPNNMVALGTHSGQCSVYQKRQGEDDSYRLLWQCHLPYSIHGLSHVNVLPSGQPSLMVTTRYTFHVFQRDTPKYCASTAKRRIEEMISQRNDAVELLKIA